MIDQNLVKHIQNLGTSAGVRVHTGSTDSPVLPLVIIRRTSGNTPSTLSGASLLSRAQFSVWAVSDNYAEAQAISSDIRAALANYRGTLDKPTGGTDTKIYSGRCVADPVDISEKDGDRILRGLSQEFLFVYSEAS